VELKIGVQQTARELTLDLDPGTDRDELKRRITESLADADSVLWLLDAKGREVCVPSAKVAYVELGPAADARRIGFGG
jgi:hypothetical protein